MYEIKFVIVFLCLINIAEFRTLYYCPDRADPGTYIAFDGPTNCDYRKVSDNEVDPDYSKLIDVRFLGVDTDYQNLPTATPEPYSGFVFPDD